MEFGSHRHSDNVKIGDGVIKVIIFKKVWLLKNSTECIVVSWERIESTKYIPTSTEFWSGVTIETADVSAWELDTHDIVVHDADHRVTHIFSSAFVIS